MRIWRFYLITDKNKLRKNLYKKTMREKYPLYAITNKRDRAEEFISTRDMDQFLVQETKGVDADEWTTFANRNRGAVLEYHRLITRRQNWTPENGTRILGLTEKVDVLMTYDEYTNTEEIASEEGTAQSLSSLWDTEGYDFPDPSFFKPEVVELFRKLGYPAQYKMFKGVDDPIYQPLEEDDDYSFGAFGPNRNFAYDELVIFIKEHGDTYK